MKFDHRAGTGALFLWALLVPCILMVAPGCGRNNPSSSTQASETRDPGMPAINGIYMSGPDGTASVVQDRLIVELDVHRYFRFYEDGTVIGGVGTATPEELTKWFHRDKSENVGRGTYHVRMDGPILFSTTSEAGTVEYTGVIQGDTIKLDFHSRINDNRGSYECRFLPGF